MTNGRLTSYKTIVDKFYRDFPLNYELTDDTILEWLGEFMAHSNSPVVLEIKESIIDIVDGRGKLPNDLELIIQAAIAQPCDKLTREKVESGCVKLLPMRWATDSFHTRYHCDKRDYNNRCNYTYQVNSNYIFTSVDKGFVVLAYRAIPTDAEGFPMIPADQPWIEAASRYLAYRVAKIMWLKDDLTDNKFQHFEREKEWYFAQAVNYSKIPSLDEMESFKNDRIRTIPTLNDHSNFFANFQLPEKRHWRKNYDGS